MHSNSIRFFVAAGSRVARTSAALGLLILGAGLSPASLRAEGTVATPSPAPGADPFHWCRTETDHPAANVAGNTCPTAGPCDVPGNRNVSIPSADQPFTVIRIKFNVFANNDGSNPAASPASVQAQLNQLNADYAPLRIQFQGEVEFINNSQYRVFNDGEEGAMKNAYADDPARKLNVYVLDNIFTYAVGTFPWNPIALGPLGGIMIDDNMFGPGRKILAHEVGHCVGLWHTHHGVSEVVDCGTCYEFADGTNGDVAGDFCSDTATTPVNFFCGPPGGVDCQGDLFGETDWVNYMGYAADGCYTEFSTQQWGRMHCWLHNAVASWVMDCNHNGVDDVTDVETGASLDCDGNVFPDECQLDCNSNSVPDVCDFVGGFEDCDGNTNPDVCDPDFDGDQLIDACDDDIDNDGVDNVTDPCDFTPLGAPVTDTGAPKFDTDGDCDVDLVDYKRFRNCIVVGGPGSNASNFCENLFDIDADDNIDLMDIGSLQRSYTGAQ